MLFSGSKDELLQLVEQLHPESSNEWNAIKLERGIKWDFTGISSESGAGCLHDHLGAG